LEAVKLVPLGDQALLAYLADEASAVRFAAEIRAANPPWLQDVVPAYASVGVFFDADAIGTAEVMAWLRRLREGEAPAEPPILWRSWEGEAPAEPCDELTARLEPRPPARFTIPVCYEFAPDMPRVCEHTGLTSDAVIRLHTSTELTVYAIGFVPGFPYLGYLPKELCGVGRLPSPRVRVEPGSVGLTGRQTGIYPLPRPGGWNLIGRTPLTIVDVAAGFFPLRVGDVVRFARIDEKRYRELEGERLASCAQVPG
jgi:inhibitor of KinA